MNIRWPPSNRTVGLIDVLGLSAWAGLLVARFIPVARLPFWGCALRRTTGWPCPACGLTRVADRLSHFNLAGAWDANPLGTVAGLVLLALGFVSGLHLVLGLPLPTLSLSPREARGIRIAVWFLIVANYLFLILKAKFSAFL